MLFQCLCGFELVCHFTQADDEPLLSTIKDFEEVKEYVKQYGYIEGNNLYDFRHAIGVNEIDYLQIKNPELNFDEVLLSERPNVYQGTDNYCSMRVKVVEMEAFMKEIKNLEDSVALFDYGCGKGQMLVSSWLSGIDKIGGVELVKDICEQARKNMEVLKIPARIFCSDAKRFTEIDDYNVFYFNNPFGGSIFREVIDNIENSIRKKPRRVHLLYLNGDYHEEVIKHGVFRLDRQKYVETGDPLINFYVADKFETNK